MATEHTRTFSGFTPDEVDCHCVAFRYWDIASDLTVDLEKALAEEAEERAATLIPQGCHCGELCCLYPIVSGEEEEIFGWWEITPHKLTPARSA